MRLLTSRPGAHSAAHITVTISYAGSAAAASTTTANTNLTPSTKIRPRGLINSGNMCFANSVLHIMVYRPPFHRLFAELGKVLGAVGLSRVAGVSGNETGAEASAYLLVEATVEFLREFVENDDKSKDSKEKGKVNANVNGKVASGSASGSGSSRISSLQGGKARREGANRSGVILSTMPAEEVQWGGRKTMTVFVLVLLGE